MFEQELVRLMEGYRRYEEMTNPFKYCQDTEVNPYIAMKKKQYDSELMEGIRFKQFLAHPHYKPLIERLKDTLLGDVEIELSKEIENTLDKVIKELNLNT